MILFIVSCDTATKKQYGTGSAKFNQVLKEVATQKLPNALLVARVDSAFKNIDYPTPEEQCRRYQFKNTHFVGNESSPIAYLDSIILIIEKNKLEIKLSDIYNDALLSKGDSLIKKFDYKNASIHFYKAAQNIKKTKNHCLYANFNIRLADIEYRQQQYVKSIEYNKAVLYEFDRCKDKKFINYHYYTATLDNIALCFDKYGKPDSAIYYFDKALAYIGSYEDEFPQEKKNIEMSKGVIYGNMGTIFNKMKKLPEAEALYKKSIAINSKEGYENTDALLTQIKLVEQYLSVSNLKEAKTLLETIHRKISSLPVSLYIPNTKLRFYKAEAAYNEVVNQHKEANKYLRSYIALRDTVILTNKDLIHTNFEQDFTDLTQKQSLSLLKKETQIKTLYLSIATIFTLLSVVIMLIIWHNRKRLKQLNVKISAQNSDMQKALLALQQSQDENTRLVKIVAHDLRSPMAITISIADIMLATDGLKESDKEMLDLIKTANYSSLEMIVDLLNMNTTKEELKTEPVEIHNLLRYCVDIFSFKAAEKKQKIILQSQEATLHLNREKIWRVMNNLITNAIKFSPEGSQIDLNMTIEKDSILIKVKDQGIGIPEELRNKIFDLSTDAKRLGTSGELSFGLGLYIAKQIVEAHHGKIWFESKQNQGTTFFISLPIDIG